jgi:hypothetical protein
MLLSDFGFLFALLRRRLLGSFAPHASQASALLAVAAARRPPSVLAWGSPVACVVTCFVVWFVDGAGNAGGAAELAFEG